MFNSKTVFAAVIMACSLCAQAADSTSLKPDDNVAAKSDSGGAGYLSPSKFEATFAGAKGKVGANVASCLVSAASIAPGACARWSEGFEGSVNVSPDGKSATVSGVKYTFISSTRKGTPIPVNTTVYSVPSSLTYQGAGVIVTPTMNGALTVTGAGMFSRYAGGGYLD